MLAIIKKPFLYAHDGIHVEELAVGLWREIADEVSDGLIAAGYIGAAPQNDATAPIADMQKDNATLSVRHIGRGKYDVFRGDARVTRDATTKEEAEAALAALS